MAISAGLGYGIAAGITALSSGAQVIAQGKMNRKSINWAKEQMATQRQWALQDWAMQNEYNSPRAQMQRLQEAGLNPNLVYGDGATTNAAPVRSVDTNRPEFKTPDYHSLGQAAMQGLSAYYDLQQRKAQTDLLGKQLMLADADANIKAAQVRGINLDNDSKAIELGRKPELTDLLVQEKNLDVQGKTLSLPKIIADTEKTIADTRYTDQQREIAAAQSASSLKEALLRMVGIRLENANKQLNLAKTSAETARINQDISNLQKLATGIDYDNRIKRLDAEIATGGNRPQDAGWSRYLTGTLKEMLDKLRGRPIIP